MSSLPVATWVDDTIILVHDNGCIEVLGCVSTTRVSGKGRKAKYVQDMDVYAQSVTCELDYYANGGTITHNACEFACTEEGK